MLSRTVETVFKLKFLAALAFAADLSAAQPASSPPLPWEIWRDLRSLAVLDPGDQVLMRSSYCPTGCGSDKHAPGDSRFLRTLGEQGVIFEEAGPGAITRIWMTSGDTQSVPLDPAVRIRFYLDGEAKPRIDLPLPDLFSGAAPPFTPPLVGDRLASSGGYFSYVPIPFARSCLVTLTGAESLRLWFQFNFHRHSGHVLSGGQAVTTYTGAEDLEAWRALLSTAPGADPWPAGAAGPSTQRLFPFAAASERTIYAASGPGLLTRLTLALPRSAWPSTELELRFDGETTVALAVADFFGVGADPRKPTRSLLTGADAQGGLYSYFPMPFERSVEIVLRSTAPAGSGDVVVGYGVRRHAEGPLPGSGTFGAQLRVEDPAPAGADLELLRLDRPGKWVGLAAQLGSVATLQRRYLEGDERVYVDGAPEPRLHGTGIEDFFNGGFYFDQGEFGRPLHGMTAHQTAGGEDRVSAYRLLLADAVPFARELRVDLEPGTTGEVPMRARAVSWYYMVPGAATAPLDRMRCRRNVAVPAASRGSANRT